MTAPMTALPLTALRDFATGFVIRELGISATDLCSHRKPQHLVAARALFVWIVRTHGPDFLSYPEIGRWLGGRDHTTIRHLYLNRVPVLRQRDTTFSELCRRASERITKEQITWH